MRRSFVTVASLFAALVLSSAAGCGGGKHEPAKAPEGNPWADYKGTYAGAPEARTTEPVKPNSSSADTKAVVDPVAAPKADEDAAAPAAPAKKAAGKKRTKGVAKKAPKKG